jgi:preprotein translocase subunit SecG
LFGATGSSNFMSKSTGVAAAIFFASTLALAYLGTNRTVSTGGVMDRVTVPVNKAPANAGAAVPATTPVAPAAAPAAPAVPAASAPAPAPATPASQIPK